MEVRCFHHPEEEAEATCLYCGRSLCGECLVKRTDYSCCKDEGNCLEYQEGEVEAPSYSLISNAHSLLEAYSDRLAEVREELHELKTEYGSSIQSDEGLNDGTENDDQREVTENRRKIKGYLAFHTAREGIALINLMTVIIEYVRASRDQHDEELIERAEAEKLQMDEVTPQLRKVMEETKPFQTFDSGDMEKAVGDQNL